MIDPNDTVAIKDIVTIASPFIKSLVETYITPKLTGFKKRLGLDYKKYYIPTEEHFSEYFHRTYKRLSIANTLVFNNSQQLLKEIYIPLTLLKSGKNESKQKIESYPQKLVDRYEKILITDTAGMGKSTLMKKIFLDIIDKKIGIPILIELRRLSKDKPILNELQEQLNAIDKKFESNLLFELIKEGDFIFILDGYDEISLNEREFVTTDIQDFILKAVGNKFLLTSRPENALSSFGDFQQFTIEPLKKREAFELLRKYDKQGAISTLLIKKLEDRENSNIDEFLTNPLLVSLLFTAFQHKQAIPFKKYLFYRQVYDANFESHDLTKGDSYSHDKYSKLEIDDFHRVLRHIGFSCFKTQKIEFSKDELLTLIRESNKFCVGLNFSESDFLKDILVTVPLFTQDGNYFRWAHKSLQEYFAAQFIYLDSKEQQAKLLIKIYSHSDLEKFINILDLFYDMDFKAFRNIIMYEFLKEYKNHFETYLVASDKSIPEDQLILRKEFCFLNRPFLFHADPFENKKLRKMIDTFLKKNEIVNNKFSGLLISSARGHGTYCIYYDDSKETILSLLIRKKHPCVDQIKRYRENPSLNITYSFSNDFELVEVTGDPLSEINSQIDFIELNKLLELSRGHSVKIKTAEAFRTLTEIEENLKSENSSNFLLEGI